MPDYDKTTGQIKSDVQSDTTADDVQPTVDHVTGFKHFWSELGNLLDEAESDTDAAAFREDVATVRHFWNQLGSVLVHVQRKRGVAEEDL